MEIPSKTFCSMAWDHQFIDPTGRVKPCCRFAEKFRPNENNLNEKTLSDVFYGDWMNNVRSQMMQGEQVPGCIRCYQEEEAGKKSLRERYHDNTDLPIDELVDIDNPTIRWIELAISNDCNLACRMCDSRYAWKWFKEEQEIFGKTLNSVEKSKSDIANVFPFINDLVHIKFTGGEPLMTKDQWALVDKMLDERDCSDILLNYSTNCTIMPKQSWIDKWSKFKKVEFALSFDSANKEESEYIRWPANYETTEAVTKRFLELKQTHGFQVFLRSTISLLNVWHMPESLQWWYDNDPGPWKGMNPTHLTYPENLCVTVLPGHVKERITNKFTEYQNNCKIDKINNSLEYIKNFMNSKDDSHLLPDLQKYLSGTDKYRGQDFFESYPQFNDIFKDI
jgi:organic radical activating enzyme